MATSFTGWGNSWGDSWGTVTVDPNAMTGTALFSFSAYLQVSGNDMSGSASFAFSASLQVSQQIESNEIGLSQRKKWYIKRGKKYLIFDTPEEADAWESAETMANAAIEKAQKTSRMARNRVKRKIYSAAPIPEVIDSSALSFLASKFAPELDIEPLIQDNDVSELERIYLILKDRQEEEDIELLLLA